MNQTHEVANLMGRVGVLEDALSRIRTEVDLLHCKVDVAPNKQRHLLAEALDLLEEAEFGGDTPEYRCPWCGSEEREHWNDCPWLSLMKKAGRR